MLRDNHYERKIAARILDFCSNLTGWQRRLWGAGVNLALHETLEASECVKSSVLSPSALNYLVDSVKRLVKKDQGIDSNDKKSLSECLKTDLTYDGYHFRQLRILSQNIEKDYLLRWANAFDSQQQPKVERAARAIAGHLLDKGISPTYLHKWWTYQIRYEKGENSLSDIIRMANKELACRNCSKYKVLVTYSSAPQIQGTGIDHLSARQVTEWFVKQGIVTKSLRQHGGFLIDVEAKDDWSAIEEAKECIDRVIARFAIGKRGKKIIPYSTAWIEGKSIDYKLRESRRVEVRALEREGQLLSVNCPSPVDNALELLSPLNDGPTSSSVAGGWAAIESLLYMHGDRDRVDAADRMANLITCSWPRAELTMLAHRYVRQKDDDLSKLIKSKEENRNRAKIIADAISRNSSIVFSDLSDAAAYERMKDILADPYTRLKDVNAHIVNSIRRFYRQRNLVLHGAKVHAVSLRASLRTAAPLIGAGFDRIAHAWFAYGIDPKELAALAEIRLNNLSGKGDASIVDLLEPRL